MSEHSLFLAPLSEEKIPLFKSLRALDPELGHHILSAVHEREDELLRTGTSGGRRTRLAERLGRARIFAEQDLDEIVEAYCAYLSRCHLSMMFSMIYMGKIDRFIHFDGLDELHTLRDRGEKLVLVPFHIRHWQSLMNVVLGTAVPVTIIGHPDAGGLQGPVSTIVDDPDVEVLSAMDRSVLLRCRSAVHRGRTLMWFPELYVGSAPPQGRMRFLDETVPMSHTLPRFCRFEGATAIPCYVYERTDDRILGAVFGPPIPPPESRDDDAAYLQNLCRSYEEVLQRDGSVIEWHGWYSDIAPVQAVPA